MGFSESLNRLLQEKGIRKAQLSRMTGISDSNISDYASGKKVPSLTNAIAMADALAVSLDELAGRSAPRRVIEGALLSEFRNLSDEGQEVAVATVRGLGVTYGRLAEPVRGDGACSQVQAIA